MFLHIVDSSDANYVGHERTVRELLHELEVEKIPSLTVYNKKRCAASIFFTVSEGRTYCNKCV
ncbi:hypothetical protein GCM10020331_049540 [Ectobacillus funiculus]